MKIKDTYPSTPTAQTNVRSPRILSVPILSPTRPVAKSHLRKLLSEHPATTHESDHSSSPSSSEPSVSFVSLGTGGPQARLSILLFTRSSRRRWVSVSCSSDSNRTAPSSQPIARMVDAGLGDIHQMDPPCDGMVRCVEIISNHKITRRVVTHADT